MGGTATMIKTAEPPAMALYSWKATVDIEVDINKATLTDLDAAITQWETGEQNG
jgi:hypothetical protein